MASIDIGNVTPVLKEFANWAGNRSILWPTAAGVLIAGWVTARYGSNFAAMTTEDAVAVTGVMMSAAGVGSQFIVSNYFHEIDRGVNVLELGVPVAVSVGVALLILSQLIPPKSDFVYTTMKQAGWT